MSFQELIQDFSRQWGDAAEERAINRGVPEHLARNRQWTQFVNLCPTSVGTWALASFGDDNFLVEWTMDEIEQAIAWVPPQEPDTAAKPICAHSAKRWTSHDFSDPVGSLFFVISQFGKDYTGRRSITLEWFGRMQTGNAKVEECLIFLHLDGTISLLRPGAHTLALLNELAIVVVDERRPTNAKEAFESHKHQFIVSHAPSVERQKELAVELGRYHVASVQEI